MSDSILEISIDNAEFLDMCDDGDQPWKLHSFNRSYRDYSDPGRWLDVSRGLDGSGDPYYIDAETEKAFQEDWKFVCSCYQHSGTVWSLKGEGPQCRWDTCQIAGILEVREGDYDPGADIPQEAHLRREHARRWLRDYTDWCNGSVFEVYIGDEAFGTWFLHDSPDMIKTLNAELQTRNVTKVRLSGDAADLFRDDLAGLPFELVESE